MRRRDRRRARRRREKRLVEDLAHDDLELLAQIALRRADVWAHAADGTPYDNRDIHEIGEEAARKACV